MKLKAIYYTCPQGSHLLFTESANDADLLFDAFNAHVFTSMVVHKAPITEDYEIKVIDNTEIDPVLLTRRSNSGITFYVYTEDLDERGYHKKDINRTYNFDLSTRQD